MPKRSGRDGHSVAAVARNYGVGWHTVMRAVIDHGTPLIEDSARLAGVTALGIDETPRLRANGQHPTVFVSGLVDTATGRLLDVVADRTIRAVAGWLAHRDSDWLARIGVVTLDPYRGYATAVGRHLGHATPVVDLALHQPRVEQREAPGRGSTSTSSSTSSAARSWPGPARPSSRHGRTDGAH